MKILIAEPDSSITQSFGGILESNGYDPTSVNSVKEAISIIGTFRPLGLVLIGLGSDASEWYELLRYLASNPRLRKIPVLICSSLNDPFVVMKCAELGVREYALMPVAPEALLARVQKLTASNEGAVLIVDDDAVLLDLLAKVVQREGFGVLTATSGEDALKIISARKVLAVVSDIGMPGMSGIDLLKTIKEKHKNIPVLLVTGNAGKFSRGEAEDAGADGYVTKPFRNVEIARQLATFREQLVNPKSKARAQSTPAR